MGQENFPLMTDNHKLSLRLPPSNLPTQGESSPDYRDATYLSKVGAVPLFSFEDDCDPLNGECPRCKGRWLYCHVTDGDGRTSMVEDWFEIWEPCELHE